MVIIQFICLYSGSGRIIFRVFLPGGDCPVAGPSRFCDPSASGVPEYESHMKTADDQSHSAGRRYLLKGLSAWFWQFTF